MSTAYFQPGVKLRITFLLALALPPFTGLAQSPLINQSTPQEQQLTSRGIAKEWTLLIYMNGKNNLEEYAIKDFEELAKVGSSDDLNVVVQMGRLANRYSNAYGDWAGVKRFYVERGDQPTAQQSLYDLAANGQSTDMGSKDTLANFIKWGVQAYPAKKTMLVVWNHGQGWRLYTAATLNSTTLFSRSRSAASGTTHGGYRSVSGDDEFNTIIYNTEVAQAIKVAIPSKKLDIIGFDACLMAMVETGYELKDLAEVMVASEELEGGDGWNYEIVLRRLASSPAASPEQFAEIIVDAYRQDPGHTDDATLSAVRLQHIPALVAQIDNLSAVTQSESDFASARAARFGMLSYNRNGGTSVDLGLFLQKLQALSPNPRVVNLAEATQLKLQEAMIDNFASNTRKPHGSNGLAIYFPENQAVFSSDPDHSGYKRSNGDRPVAFVRDSKWPEFLKQGFGIPTD